MYGAILGDIIGGRFEYIDEVNSKSKEFSLFTKKSHYTDDTVMTIAVAETLMSVSGEEAEDVIIAKLVPSLKKWGKRYPHVDYGYRFYKWIQNPDPKPYESYGNGSAMRVSSAAWLYDTLKVTRRIARLTAMITHNHPEGIKGAEAIASAIYLARTGHSKEKIKDYILKTFGYDLSRTCDQIRPAYHYVATCQGIVPEAITAFLEGKDFEDVVRNAVSLGGKSDTLACIAGSIAEAYFGVPEELKEECRNRLPNDMLAVLDSFDKVKKEQVSRIQVTSESKEEGEKEEQAAKQTREKEDGGQKEKEDSPIFHATFTYLPGKRLTEGADFARMCRISI